MQLSSLSLLRYNLFNDNYHNINIMNLEKIFNSLGLKTEHLKLYLSSLEWGETIITNIAYKANTPRTSAYIFFIFLLSMN